MTAEVSAQVRAPASDVLARRHQVACDTESVRELTPLGHAQPQAEPADHPRYGCGDEEVEILPDEHEQRMQTMTPHQKPEAARTASRRAAPELERHEVSASPRACLPPSIGRRRRRPHSPTKTPIGSSSGTPRRCGRVVVARREADERAAHRDEQAEDLDEDHSKERRSILRSAAHMTTTRRDRRELRSGRHGLNEAPKPPLASFFARSRACSAVPVAGSSVPRRATTTQVPSPAQRLIPVERAGG